jgi:hypothetical protein
MLQKFVQGVQFVLEYEAYIGSNRVFREVNYRSNNQEERKG